MLSMEDLADLISKGNNAVDAAGNAVKGGYAGIGDLVAGNGLGQAAADVNNVESGAPAETTAGKVGSAAGGFFTPKQIALAAIIGPAMKGVQGMIPGEAGAVSLGGAGEAARKVPQSAAELADMASGLTKGDVIPVAQGGAQYVGVQKGVFELPDTHLFNAVGDNLPEGVVKNSTYSPETMEKLGMFKGADARMADVAESADKAPFPEDEALDEPSRSDEPFDLNALGKQGLPEPPDMGGNYSLVGRYPPATEGTLMPFKEEVDAALPEETNSLLAKKSWRGADVNSENATDFDKASGGAANELPDTTQRSPFAKYKAYTDYKNTPPISEEAYNANKLAAEAKLKPVDKAMKIALEDSPIKQRVWGWMKQGVLNANDMIDKVGGSRQAAAKHMSEIADLIREQFNNIPK